jgi:hypothetical protein
MMIFAPPQQRLFAVPRSQFSYNAHSINVRRNTGQRYNRPIPAFQSGDAGDGPADQKMGYWTHAAFLWVAIQFSGPCAGLLHLRPAEEIISQSVGKRKN